MYNLSWISLGIEYLIDLYRIHFGSEAKDDNLIGVHQTKVVKPWIDVYNLNRSLVLGNS